MMKIEWVTGAPYVVLNEGGTLVINYDKWAMLTKAERLGVLAHERMHETFASKERMYLPDSDEDIFESHDSSNHDRCPLCDNAETCESCGGPWPKSVPSEVELLRAERVQLQKDIGEVGAEYATLRNAVAHAISVWEKTPEWELSDVMTPIMRNLYVLMEE
jgi:hypothetical protein